MMKAQEHARAQADIYRKQLRDLLRIPSISTDPVHAADVRRCASWLVDDFRRIGLQAEVITTQRHPLVYAEWLEAGDDTPTVLIYGHYDVQPARREDGWNSQPFEPIERDGKIYARGASDDKGQMFAHIKAVESILATEGKLPVNVKFILEGEEESGGDSIAAYVPQNTDKLKADMCLISDGGMPAIESPVIVTSLRGIIALEIHVYGPSSDLHSGMYGGTVHNPLQALTEIISKLHDENGVITVPGFYDEVYQLTDEERADVNYVAWTDEKWVEETGAPKPYGEPGYSLLERIGTRPTLEINGLVGGYGGEGTKTVLPAKATAKITCRLVAHQNPQRTFDCIQDYLAQITPDTVKSEAVLLHQGDAAMVDSNDPAILAAVRAYEKAWGAKPYFRREGGSIPIVSGFQKHLNVPVILMGFGLNSDGLHAPNEHFTIEMFHRGIDTSIQYLYEVASTE